MGYMNLVDWDYFIIVSEIVKCMIYICMYLTINF